MSVKLVWITPAPEQQVMYCARVSSPHRQSSNDTRLLKYCIKHKHWSPFEMASMCVEINTTRMISAQILRHRSFHFQEFSQRYAVVTTEPQMPEMRMSGATNRQSSISRPLTDGQKAIVQRAWNLTTLLYGAYEEMIHSGIAAESARAMLPMCTPTRLYMSGTMRDWLHYAAVRTSEDTQLEHRDIADAVAKLLEEHVPVTWEAFKACWIDPEREQTDSTQLPQNQQS